MATGDWSDSENDATVADYFSMLSDELQSRPYNKSEHNRGLQQIIGRTKGSIEFKHQNISAVLKGLGETWINGYLPAFNFQQSLEEAVVKWLKANPEWLERSSHPPLAGGLAEANALWVGPPPTHSNGPEPTELGKAAMIAQRYDVAGRDERNRKLGRSGEELVLRHEHSTLTAAGRSDLAKKIRWVSVDEGDGAGFDIASFLPNGRERLIEVKTTNGWNRTPFHISANELAVADRRRTDWVLFRLWNFSREPRAFELYPPLSAHVALTPTSFRASFS